MFPADVLTQNRHRLIYARSGYYLRSCAEILRLSRITGEIFNRIANESLLSKLTNLVNRVFRRYVCHVITLAMLFMARGRMRLKRFYTGLNTQCKI